MLTNRCYLLVVILTIISSGTSADIVIGSSQVNILANQNQVEIEEKPILVVIHDEDNNTKIEVPSKQVSHNTFEPKDATADFNYAKVAIRGIAYSPVNVQADSRFVLYGNANEISIENVTINEWQPILNNEGYKQLFLSGTVNLSKNLNKGLYIGNYKVTIIYP